MNEYTALEDRLNALGAQLRACPRLTSRVLDELRRSGESRVRIAPPPAGPRLWRRPRALMAAASSVIAIVAVALFANLIGPAPAVTWADVTAAIAARPWIRGRVVDPASRRAVMWVSPARSVWAFDLAGSVYFYDGAQRIKYQYTAGDRRLLKLPLGSGSIDQVLPVAAMSQDQATIGPWLLGTEKIVSQERRDVVEGDKKWIEFDLILWRGAQNQATLRVDPETRLPVSLVTVSPNNKALSTRWEFDYPDEGPADIYALGVPREVKIVDQLPSDDARRVLDAIDASRTQIGDFRLVIGRPEIIVVGAANDRCVPQTIVSRKGDRWRIDQRLPMAGRRPPVPPPLDGDWIAWLLEQSQQQVYSPQLICDGSTVWERPAPRPDAGHQNWRRSPNTAPQDLMSGEGSGGGLPSAPDVKFAALVYPDLWPIAGWQFDFDPAPTDAPGCVLIKRSARLATREPFVGNEWYYLDPTRGHAVVRVELFNLPPDVPADPTAATTRTSRIGEGFQRSSQGFWYPTVVRETSVQAFKGAQGQAGGAQKFGKTVRYAFDLDAGLPDELFTIDAKE